MSEIQRNSGGLDDAPSEDMYEAARRVGESIEQIIRNGRELAARRFSTYQDAEAAATAYLSECAAMQGDDKTITAHQLYAMGDGVETTNIAGTKMIDGKLTIEFDISEPYIALGNSFESKTFTYTACNVSVMQDGEESYSLEPYMFGQDSEVSTVTVQDGRGMPLGSVVTAPIVRVSCLDPSIEVGVVSLRDADEYHRVVQEIGDLPGEEGRRALEAIQQLHKIIQTEQREKLIDIDPTILHELGRIGAAYALQDYKKSDMINTAVKTTFGDGRFVEITGTSYSNTEDGSVAPELVKEFGGDIIDIIPDVPRLADATPRGTTLVIERQIGADRTIHYAAMADITKLSL